MTHRMSRRTALMSALAAPALVAAPLATRAHASEGPPILTPRARKFRVGDFDVTTLLAGTAQREEPNKIFGLNVEQDTFTEVSKENFIPTDSAQFFFTPTVVNTGSDLILFDTGLNPEGITEALGAAGIAPGDITHVVLTHMHGDHIGGLMQDGAATFANAALVTGEVEWNHWAAAGNEGFDTKVKPLQDRFSFLKDGGSVASGITAMAAFGHTPGHMTYMLESGGEQLLLMADLANHYVWSLARPDWEVLYDSDKAAAADSRRRVLGMLAADRVPLIGYHMPFPAAGFVETRGEGFHYVPVSYQMM